MLFRFLVPALLAMGGLVHAESFSDLAACGQNCINNMDTTTGCVPVTSECLCSNKDFLYGIADCANAACASSADAQNALSYASSSCAAVLATSTTVAATSAEPTTTSEAPTTTQDPETSTTALADQVSSATPESVAQAAQTSSSQEPSVAAATASSDTSATATTTSAAEATSASGASETSAGSSSSGSTATGASAASSSSSASGTTSSSSSSSSSSGGLSTGAKAGIAIGAAGAAAGVVAIIMYLSRRRKPLPRGAAYKISEPLPGAGRVGSVNSEWERFNIPQYSPVPPRGIYSAGSNMSELDRSARPYEEMVPRTTPARMV